MKKKFKSGAAEAVYELASALHEAGAITKKSMRQYDKMALKPVPKKTKKTSR